MKTHYTLAIGLFAGAVIGALAIGGLQAQNKQPGAYFVSEINVTNQDVYMKDYASKVGATFQPFGGQYLSRGANVVATDGEAPQRVVIIAFDSAQKAADWRKSATYQALVPIRDKSSKVRSYAVDAKVN
jgi:uncharacterized protein (DUF1330 family)